MVPRSFGSESVQQPSVRDATDSVADCQRPGRRGVESENCDRYKQAPRQPKPKDQEACKFGLVAPRYDVASRNETEQSICGYE